RTVKNVFILYRQFWEWWIKKRPYPEVKPIGKGILVAFYCASGVGFYIYIIGVSFVIHLAGSGCSSCDGFVDRKGSVGCRIHPYICFVYIESLSIDFGIGEGLEVQGFRTAFHKDFRIGGGFEHKRMTIYFGFNIT